MRLLALIFTLMLALPAYAADYAREKRWADEVLPAVLVGDPVWLEDGPHKFLALHTQAPKAKAAVILVHGNGVHPDWGLIGMLRQQLPDAGYTTLSVQMPVLRADAKTEEYTPLFPEASRRLQKAVAFLKDKGYAKVAIVSHSLGCSMSTIFLHGQGGNDVNTWVALNMSGNEDWSDLKLPILDLYGANDLPHVLKSAPQRAKSLKNTASKQIKMENADHFFEGQDAALLEKVKNHLDKTL